MSFAWPHLLFLLVVPVAWIAWDLTRRKLVGEQEHPKILSANAGTDNVSLEDTVQRTKIKTKKRYLLASGIFFAIIALARPQWGHVEEPVFDQSREVLLALDLSRSMLTPDVKPTRLDRSKLLIQSLLDNLVGERVGLVLFSGTSFLQSPLSADYEILREFLPSLNPDYMPDGGTDYGALLDTAADAFSSGSGADRYLIILSDGAATDDAWRDHIEKLKEKNIRVIGLGVGTPTGALIPDGSGGYLKDDQGAVVMAKLESQTLQELAQKTNGTYRDASNWVDLNELLKQTISEGQKGKFVEKKTIQLVERFQWALAPALILLLLSIWREFPVRPKERDLRSRALKKAATVVVVILAISTQTTFAAATIQAPTQQVNQSTSGAMIGRIVGRLSGPISPSARDWSELAQQTLTWGDDIKKENGTIPEGPVRDALAGVTAGESLDKKAADWSTLRSKLEELLQKKEDKKEEQKKQDQKQDQKQDKDDKQKQDQKDKNDKSQNKDQKDSKSSDSKDQQSKADQNKSEQQKKQQQQKNSESAFGDMKSPPQKPQSGKQDVGGVKKNERPDPAKQDEALAAPLQKLDAIKENDSPAELFQMIQNTEPHPQTKKGKNW